MKITRRFLAAALVAVPIAATLALGNPVAAQDQSDLAKVSAYIRAAKTLVAGFSQTDRNGQVLTGTLTLKQPGKIRFQYQKDVPLLVVSDGKALTIIDYEVRQVQSLPVRNSPLGALLDPDRDLAKYSRIIASPDAATLTVMTRDPKHPEYGTISLVFQRNAAAPAGLQLYGWIAQDAQNNRTTIRLTGHRYNGTVADSAFRWMDPRGSGPRGK
jgi:outer membrane lipoprotein-sorting protein